MNTESEGNPQVEAGYQEPLNSMGYLCRVNFRLFSRALEARIAAHGVSSGQWRSLRVLWEEDWLTQRELSVRVGTTEATTVAMLRSLERDKLVVRRQDKLDRRKVRVHLTAKARRLRERLLPYVAEVNALACAGMRPDELEVARSVLVRMYRNLEQARAGASGSAETTAPPAA